MPAMQRSLLLTMRMAAQVFNCHFGNFGILGNRFLAAPVMWFELFKS
jgi:hypothetical protein